MNKPPKYIVWFDRCDRCRMCDTMAEALAAVNEDETGTIYVSLGLPISDKDGVVPPPNIRDVLEEGWFRP